MDEKRNNTAAEAENEENTLILKLAKPYKFEGTEYTEVDLHGLEDTTAADLSAVGKILAKQGVVSPMPEMTMDFSQYLAARVAKKPVEFFQGLPAREAVKLKNIVTGFLYGEDGDN